MSIILLYIDFDRARNQLTLVDSIIFSKHLYRTTVLLIKQMFDLTKKERKVLNFFLDFSLKQFHVREIARKLSISSSTAKLSVDKLKKNNLIEETKIVNLRLFQVNLENKIVQEMKRTKNLDLITKSNIIKEIENPISVVLFGSFAKGTNNEDSDIDLLIITNKKKPINVVDINGHELQLIQMTPLEWKEKVKKDKPFYQEIITTGIAILGELPL